MRTTTLDSRQWLARWIAFAAFATAAFALIGCGSGVTVRSTAVPGTGVAQYNSFRLLKVPPRANGNGNGNGDIALPYDPMLDNSITSQALQDEIRRALTARGYRYSPEGADLEIAYYSTAGRVLDITSYDYPYDWRFGPYPSVTTYQQGTVLIDAVDAKTKKLLWRGQAVAEVSSDPNKYQRQLRKAADKIINQFPMRQ